MKTRMKTKKIAQYICLTILSIASPILITWGKPHLIPAFIAGMLIGASTTIMFVSAIVHNILTKIKEGGE